MDAMDGLFDTLESIKAESMELGALAAGTLTGLVGAHYVTGFAQPYLEKVPAVGEYLGKAAPAIPLAVGIGLMKYRPTQRGPARDAVTGLAVGMGAYGAGKLLRTALESFGVTAPAAKFLPNLDGLNDAFLPPGTSLPMLPYSTGVSGAPVSIEELNGAPVTVETLGYGQSGYYAPVAV